MNDFTIMTFHKKDITPKQCSNIIDWNIIYNSEYYKLDDYNYIVVIGNKAYKTYYVNGYKVIEEKRRG